MASEELPGVAVLLEEWDAAGDAWSATVLQQCGNEVLWRYQHVLRMSTFRQSVRSSVPGATS